MQREKLTMGAILACVILVSVGFSGCSEPKQNHLEYIHVKNECNEELKVQLYVDGKSLGYFYVGAGDEDRVDANYESGTHRIDVETKYHSAGVNIDASKVWWVMFYLHADGSVTYMTG